MKYEMTISPPSPTSPNFRNNDGYDISRRCLGLLFFFDGMTNEFCVYAKHNG